MSEEIMEKDYTNIYRMLTVDEAVDYLGISERTVRQMITDGVLPCWKPSPGVVRIPYWVLIWQVSKQNGVDLDQLAPVSVTKVVTMLADA